MEKTTKRGVYGCVHVLLLLCRFCLMIFSLGLGRDGKGERRVGEEGRGGSDGKV